MSDIKQKMVNATEEHLEAAANALEGLGRHKDAAKVRKIAERAARERVEYADGLYRIEGVPWERFAGQWSSTRYSATEANDQDVLARYGLPVPIVEVGESQEAFEYEDVPTADSLQALLTHGGTWVSSPDFDRVMRFIEILKPIDERRMP